jgi:YidC/Oxa1 family membrane protein insertase
MEKRVLIAVVLSFLVLYAYQAIVPAPKPKAQPASAGAPRSSAPAAATQGTPQSPAEAASQAQSPAAPPVGQSSLAKSTETPANAAPSAAALEAEPAREIRIETSTVIARFTTRGAQLTSWELKHYVDQHGRLVDMVPAHMPDNLPRPFALRTEDPAVTDALNRGTYAVRLNDAPLTDDRATIDAPSTLTFTHADDSGLRAEKRFRISPDGYVVQLSLAVANGDRVLNPVVEWGPGPGDSIFIVGQKSTTGYDQRPQGILMKDGKVVRLAHSGIQEQPSHQGAFPFAGIDDHYFIATLVEPGTVRVNYEIATPPMPGTSQQRDLVSFNALFAAPPQDAKFFVGPKDFDVLAAVDRPLVKAIHFGVLDFLAVPLLRALKWIDSYIGNYGWSIIILTILINIVMFPLRHKSVVSMRKMQQLQPQIKAIQERYAKFKATDPERQKMNQELMTLYREKGVNPASGCLPMLLTMPVLFAFYSLLSVAIEMRGAPFALWIHDLSAHDPYYITPLIMGATMFWQQRLTPVADPAQAKIMMLTPIMFLFFFLWAPSGLVIYWTVSNLLGIGQQYATNRMIGAPVVSQVRPPAQRQMKSAGAGRTEGARKA